MQDLLQKVNSKEFEHKVFSVKISYLEIYNEKIRDLLVPKD